MIRFFLFISLCLLGISFLSERTFASAVYEIDFSSDETLKPVFDSGLRPWRMSRMETQGCRLENKSIRVKISGLVVLPKFDAEWINIGVVKGNLLSRVEGVSKNLAISEAREMMLPYLAIAKTSQAPLEEFFKIVEAYPGGFSKDYGVGQKGNPNWGVSFRKTFNDKKPLNMVLVITWTRKTKDYRYLETPIPPPPGYEGVNMDAPPRASAIAQTNAPAPDPQITQPVATPKTPSKPTATPNQIDEQKSPTPWIWLVIAIGILVGSIVFYLHKNKNF